MGAQHGGTVTFLFTDIEGSTRRWQEHPEAMRAALEWHDSLLADAVEGHGGHVFKHTGDGICAVFATTSDAVSAAVAAQQALAAADWDAVGGLAVRAALHTGEAQQRDGDFFGPAVNRAARIMGIAHGGQVLLSAATAALMAEGLPPGIQLADLGEHRLRDLVHSEHLYQVIGDGLRLEFPTLRSLDAYEHTLPLQRTSFVGRARDVADVVARLGAAPLVTLTGIGGAGKTRLALEAASAVLDHHPDGAFFVDLSGVTDGTLVGTAIAQAVGLQRGGGAGDATSGSAVDDVLAHLSARRLLLVLDNCEHLVDDCADVADSILARCPGVTVLATSREALSVEGEQIIGVGSLDTAGTDGAEPEAVRLFAERAAAVDRTFELADHREEVAEICRRLDGIPLAIELAAGQMGQLAPADILSRLDDRLRLLTGGRRRVQRQQTLQAALDWSHDLLAPAEQVLLRRLAVFTGGFAIDDAEAVCAGEPLPRTHVLPSLRSLVTKSLVMATAETAGRSRYRLLETVRLYGLERLAAAGEAEVVRDAHRDRFLARLEGTPWFERFDSIERADELAADLDNIRAALEWSEAQGRPDLVGRLATGAVGLWFVHGLADEAARWAGSALAAPDLEAELRAGLRLTRALGVMLQGDYEAPPGIAEPALGEAVEPDLRLAVAGWYGFWTMADRAAAERVLLDAEELARSSCLEGWQRLVEGFFGAVAIFHRDLEAARRRFAAVVEGARPDPGSMNAWLSTNGLAVVYHVAGEHQAAARLVDSLAGLSHKAWMAYLLRLDAALAGLGVGRLEEAAGHLQAATAAVRRHGVPLAHLDCLIGFAALAWAEGDAERASRLLASVRAHHPVSFFRDPSTYALYRHYVDLVRSVLDADTARRTREEGSRIPASDALDEELARVATRYGPR